MKVTGNSDSPHTESAGYCMGEILFFAFSNGRYELVKGEFLFASA